MSNTKTVMSQAANTQGLPLDITDVFSTYLYDGAAVGSGDIQIQNNVDLNGEGGLVWTKGRSLATPHFLTDTERGGTKSVFSNLTNAEATNANLMSFNSDGFTLGSGAVGWSSIAGNGEEYCSWTFRKAPKFFDVVTWTGDGIQGRTVSHNLGVAPAVVIIKRTDSTSNWGFYVIRPSDYDILNLNTTAGISATYNYSQNIVLSGAPSEADLTLSSGAATNASGGTYVAYLFAHNDGDGGFGPDGDQDIIKCGSYTGNGSTDGPEIDLGFEPQWLLVRGVDSNFKDWVIIDNMRGFVADGNDSQALFANKTNAETARPLAPLSTGFKPTGSSSDVNTNNETYIYIAIRRGPLAPPESGTEVFDVEEGDGTAGYTSNFEVDMALRRGNVTSTGQNQITARLTQGKGMYTDATSSEYNAGGFTFDSNVGWGSSIGINSNDYSWMWKRAPNFFDVVAYTGNGTAGRTVSHNLGVAPEMIWAKQRSSSGNSWRVWYEGVPSGKMLRLNGSDGVYNETSRISDADATTFTLNDGTSGINGSGSTYIAYLFASLDGVSKVGSYTGNGGTQTIDCGFTSGARFVLIKRSNGTGDWRVLDTERGIVAGNDSYLSLNTTAAEETLRDDVDPDNSGFIVSSADSDFNEYLGEYIFYAVA